MAVKYIVFFLNIYIIFNIISCEESFIPLAQKYDAFDWRLFQAISESADGNIVVSPYAAKLLLTITKNAASGITKDEIRKALDADLPKGLSVQSWFKNVISSLEKKSYLYELISATKVFLDKRLTPNKAFVDTVEQNFHTQTEKLNFGDTRQSAKIINDWCSDNTKGIIKELVTEDLLKDAGAVLTNAMYFKGTFEDQFDKIYTDITSFYKTNGEIVNAPMMYQSAEVNYLETSELGEGTKLLRLAYEGRKFAITFILPKEKNGLDEMIANIRPGLIRKLQNEMDLQQVDIFIPKFEFESELSLKKSLNALNIRNVFTNSSRLPGFHSEGLAITDVIQKGAIKMNEQGTEVVVSSIIIDTPTGALPIPNPVFEADHPFVFFIEEEASGVLLFAGKVLDPTAK